MKTIVSGFVLFLVLVVSSFFISSSQKQPPGPQITAGQPEVLEEHKGQNPEFEFAEPTNDTLVPLEGHAEISFPKRGERK